MPLALHELAQTLGLTPPPGGEGVRIGELTDDGREVAPLRQRLEAGADPAAGVLFVARGTEDDRWRARVAQAIEAGATAVLVPEPVDPPRSVAELVAPRVDQALAARAAAALFGEPAARLHLVGVTGTNGKTTVATLTQQLLNHAETRCGLLGTVAVDEGGPDGPRPAELTTPGAIALQRHLAAMVAHGCRACAMEVSSHALDQGRVAGLRFAVAVFTNLTQDHLDYHGTMRAYAAAKARLFAALPPGAAAVLNLESPHWRTMNAALADVIGTTTRPLGELADPPNPDELAAMGAVHAGHVRELTASSAEVEVGRVDARGSASGGVAWRRVIWPMVGRHNVANALQAAAAASAVLAQVQPGPDPDGGESATAAEMWSALASVAAVPGRLETVRPEPDASPGLARPAVVVDYAHTPDALENVLRALRPVTVGRLVVVFGCGGDRDRTKRPQMAAAAVDLGDAAWLTSDNPRTEDPRQILDDAEAGLTPAQRRKLTVQIDRAAAITRAVASARPGDTVLIAGKGHEDYQIVADPASPTGTRKLHFDDREHAAAALSAWRPPDPDNPADPPHPDTVAHD